MASEAGSGTAGELGGVGVNDGDGSLPLNSSSTAGDYLTRNTPIAFWRWDTANACGA